jgi:DNA-binding CsgD family transcriptional regulator
VINALKRNIIYFKNKPSCYLDTIIGYKEDFSFDHQAFNFIYLIIAALFLFRILINLCLGIKIIELTLSHCISFFSILFIYYISRFLKKPELSKYIFLPVIVTVYSLNWIYTGGTAGVMPVYYIWLFVILGIIYKGVYRILVVSTLLINVTILIILELSDKNLVIQKIDNYLLALTKYLNFILIAVFSLFVIAFWNRLSGIDNFLNFEMSRKYQSQENSDDKIDKIISNLTSQERKVFGLILNGKTNKEIASILCIDQCTVKTHINNIYKKTGISKRSIILNLRSK